MRISLLLLFLPTLAAAQEKYVMEPGPKSPEESLKCIQPRPGFKVELMACEPAVMDPIAFAFGPDGKLWVVEMGDYPLGADGKGKPGGKIKFLEKSKPGGMYDKATVFLDHLGYPTGVMPYRKGVLITCAPDILYAEDTDKDGKADKVEKLYTGFREGNQQHRVNGLVWGLDNWIYGANGDSGGVIQSLVNRKLPPVNISGRDFRIRPWTGEIEAVSGQTQFGRHRDDWGNWFGNNNTNPMYHYVLEDRYLRRNPALSFTDIKVNVSEKPGAAPVFPISKPLPRFNTPGAVNHFTSACSAIIYRDDLFGPEFEGNSFVSEPVHNLIHREIVRREGLTFKSKRADDEQKSEFLASSDNWFRPAMIQTGPDGALWIADMYRYVIEHPEWIPKEWQAKLDLRAGHDKGRIYRVYPEEKKPREIPDLTKLDLKGLVAALDSPSGWQRDVAQQRLVLMNHKTSPLLEMGKVLKSERAQTRLHTLMTIEGMNIVVPDPIVLTFLFDPHPALRKYALLCLEQHSGRVMNTAISEMGMRIDKETDPQVLLQMCYLLGEWPGKQSAQLLLTVANKHPGERHLMAAALSGVNETTYEGLLEVLRSKPTPMIPGPIVQQVIRLNRRLAKSLDVFLFAYTVGEKVSAENISTLTFLCDTLAEERLPVTHLRDDKKAGVSSKDWATMLKVFRHARALVQDPKGELKDRTLAVHLLGRGFDDDQADLRLMEGLLNPLVPDDLQNAALAHLQRVGDNETPEALLKVWKHLSPALRGPAFDTLTSRSRWLLVTLVALESKTILPGEVDAARRDRLVNHPDREIRNLAAKVFGAASSADRGKVVNNYLLALTLEGDAKKGEKHFTRVCAACHKLGGVGQDVGPELAAVGDKSPEGLLSAILDPNRAVEPRYLNFMAVTKAGVTYTGVLAGETGSAVTLVAVDGKKHDLLRADLEELSSTGKSAMPEGLEKDLSIRDMADLLAFLRGALPKVEAKKEGPPRP